MEYTIETLFQKSVSPRCIAKLCGMNLKQVKNYIKQRKIECAEELKLKQRINNIMRIAKVNEDTAKQVYTYCLSLA